MEGDESELSPGRRIGTIVFGCALLAFGLFWTYAASLVPVRTSFSSIPPGLFPFYAGLLLAAAGLALAIAYFRRPAVPNTSNEDALDGASLMRVAGLMVALLVYILLLERVHAFITTALLCAVGLAICGMPLRPKLVIAAVLMAGLFFGIFVWWLDVPLPGSRFG